MSPLQVWLTWGGRLGSLVLKLLSRSIGALWLLGAVLALRLLLRRAPRRLLCLLWLLLALRLALPVQPSTSLSLLWNTGASVSEAGEREYARVRWDTGAPDLELHLPAVKTARVKAASFSTEKSVYRVSPAALLAPLWPLGFLALPGYAVLSALRLRRRLREAVRLEGNVWLSDRIDSPFLFGLFRPRIYLPAELEEAYREPVLRHERAHLARGDHWWKLLGWLLLSVYWFDPLLWPAYALFCRDLELACDERVVRLLPEEGRKGYASALLECSLTRSRRPSVPLAFGESGLRTRLKAVLNYRKPRLWLLLTAAVLILATALFFGTEPRALQPAADPRPHVTLAPEQEELLHREVLAANRGMYPDEGHALEAHVLLDRTEEEGTTVLWLQYLYLQLSWDGETLRETGGCRTPARLRLHSDGTWDFWQPRVDGDYARQLREELPPSLTPEDAGSQLWALPLARSCYAQAAEHYGLDPNALAARLFSALLDTGGEDPDDCIHRAPLAHQQLLYLGKYSYCWILARFREGRQTGLQGELLWRLFQELDDSAAHFNPGKAFSGGQECYEAWGDRIGKTRSADWAEQAFPGPSPALT